jgi:hypothetical protein
VLLLQRYRRPPPAGFDDWFLWARASNVTFVDEFDRLERSIEVFGGLDLVDLRRGLADFELENPVVDESTRIFQIRVENGRCVGRGQSNWVKGIGTGRRSGWEFCEVRRSTVQENPPTWSDLSLLLPPQALKDVLHLIPDTPDFLYSTHDLGHITMFQTEQDRLRDAFKAGQRKPTRSASDTAMNATMLAHSRVTGYLAVALSCQTGSPARQFREDLMTGKLVWDDSSAGYALSNQLGGLVYNASIAQDACYNAELRKVAGLFLQVRLLPRLLRCNRADRFLRLEQWSGANSIITQEGSPKAEVHAFARPLIDVTDQSCPSRCCPTSRRASFPLRLVSRCLSLADCRSCAKSPVDTCRLTGLFLSSTRIPLCMTSSRTTILRRRGTASRRA